MRNASLYRQAPDLIDEGEKATAARGIARARAKLAQSNVGRDAEGETTMRDWNVIVTVRGDRFKSACEQLERLGRVERTNYYNVLAMKVDDVGVFMETLSDWMEVYADTAEAIANVGPVTETFTFQSAEEFEAKARQSLKRFVPQLAGGRFYVRMHRRGWKEQLGRTQEERRLGDFLQHALEEIGREAEVDFDDPDYVVAIETLDNRAGAALWSRDDLRRCPFLKLG